MTLILSGTDGLSDVDGTAATPAIRGTDTNTGIFFPAADTIAFSEGGVESMRLDSSGNVGIGTTSTNGYKVAFKNGAKSQFFTTDATNSYYYTDGNFFFGATGADNVVAVTNNTERVRIDSSGNLLVGTTSNTSTLGMAVRAAFDTSASVVLGKNNGASNNTWIEFYLGGASRGQINFNGSGTTYTTSSDYRLKENIAPMTGALTKVSALKPCTYRWKETGNTGQGFIAHELQEVCPDAVTGEKDAVDAEGNPQYQGIDTSFLVATLTAAIQEQQAIIQSLTARIEALEGK